MKMVGLNPELNIKEEDFIIDKAYVGEFEYFKNSQLIDYYDSLLEKLTSGLVISPFLRQC